MIQSCLLNYPDEAAIVGRILIGYGEIETQASLCFGEALNDLDLATRVMFRSRGEAQRMYVADAFMQPKYHAIGLKNEYDGAIITVDLCRKIRNNYAHCQWNDHSSRGRGLVFASFEDAARRNDNLPISLTIRSVDLALLKSQEAYFRYAQDLLWALYWEYRKRAGREANHLCAWPQEVPPPALYNP